MPTSECGLTFTSILCVPPSSGNFAVTIKRLCWSECGGPEAVTSTTIFEKCGVKVAQEGRNAASRELVNALCCTVVFVDEIRDCNSLVACSIVSNRHFIDADSRTLKD